MPAQFPIVARVRPPGSRRRTALVELDRSGTHWRWLLSNSSMLSVTLMQTCFLQRREGCSMPCDSQCRFQAFLERHSANLLQPGVGVRESWTRAFDRGGLSIDRHVVSMKQLNSKLYR